MDINNAIEILQNHYQKQFANINHTDDNKNYFFHKIKHSYGVLQCAYRIIARDEFLSKQSEELKMRMIIWALLHDLGRFYQTNWERLLQNHEFDHWNASYNIMKQEGIEDVWLLLSAKYHNKHDDALKNIPDEPEFQKLSQQEQEEAMIIIKLVRDADKLDNIEFAVYDDMKICENFSKRMKYSYEKTGINDKLLNDFLSGRCWDRKDNHSLADEVLQFGSWINDINYSWTKDLIREIWFWKSICDYIRRKWVTENVDEVEQYFNKF